MSPLVDWLDTTAGELNEAQRRTDDLEARLTGDDRDADRRTDP